MLIAVNLLDYRLQPLFIHIIYRDSIDICDELNEIKSLAGFG